MAWGILDCLLNKHITCLLASHPDSGKEYLVGEQLTTADIVMGGVLVWAERLKMLAEGDILKQYVQNLMARPAFTRADEDFYARL